jgi:hypothetical protein
MKTFLVSLFLMLLPSLVFASGPTTQSATPEIPAGAAPIIVAGIVGAVMLVRSRRNKSK